MKDIGPCECNESQWWEQMSHFSDDAWENGDQELHFFVFRTDVGSPTLCTFYVHATLNMGIVQSVDSGTPGPEVLIQ